VWDKFLKSLPWGNLIVFGEGLLKMFIPQWDEIKKQIVYFAAYAEAASKKENRKTTGQDKKDAVVNFIWNSIKSLLPSWVPDFFIKGIVGNFIDMLIHYLNTSMPGWEEEVLKLFPTK